MEKLLCFYNEKIKFLGGGSDIANCSARVFKSKLDKNTASKTPIIPSPDITVGPRA